MIIKKLAFNDLESYNNIEMIKVYDEYRIYNEGSSFITEKVKPKHIDFAKDESMDLWRKIMNQDTCGIYTIEEEGILVAGVVIVTHSPNIHMLRNNMLNSILWDIRVDSKHQIKGIWKNVISKSNRVF